MCWSWMLELAWTCAEVFVFAKLPMSQAASVALPWAAVQGGALLLAVLCYRGAILPEKASRVKAKST